jgi:peptidoglycan/xylan/chitin deacetylase (PgdA/CDA1 family)
MNIWRPRTLIRALVLAWAVALLVVACVGDVGSASRQRPDPRSAASALESVQKGTVATGAGRPTSRLPAAATSPLLDGASALDLSREATRQHGALQRYSGTLLTGPAPSQEHTTPKAHIPIAAQLVAPTDRYAPVWSDVKIVFNRPINRSRAERALQIEPAVTGRIDWPDERTLRFQPEKLAYGTTYRVHLSGAAPDDATDSAWEWTFTTMKALTLSFDDCPWSAAEAQTMLAFLRQNHIRAMMFATGACNRQYPWLVPTLLADGHRVCNHTYSHVHLMRLSDPAVLSEIAGGVHANCNLLRPPYGEWDGPGGRIERLAAQQGYSIQMWDVETYDWSGVPASRILDQINELGGGVVLMHFQGRHTMEALRQLDLRDVVSVS